MYPCFLVNLAWSELPAVGSFSVSSQLSQVPHVVGPPAQLRMVPLRLAHDGFMSVYDLAERTKRRRLSGDAVSRR